MIGKEFKLCLEVRLIMKLQQLMSYTRRALDDYRLIDDNDKIAIGISGGKDSLALLYALSEFWE